MKHVVLVKNHKDERTRLYSLPNDREMIAKGTSVGVRYRENDLVMGETVSNSYQVVDSTFAIIADMLGMEPDTPLKPVCCIYVPEKLPEDKKDDGDA